jgi:hypothetical protein
MEIAKPTKTSDWKPADGKMVYDVCRHLNRALELIGEVQANPTMDHTLMLRIVRGWIMESQDRLLMGIPPFGGRKR